MAMAGIHVNCLAQRLEHNKYLLIGGLFKRKKEAGGGVQVSCSVFGRGMWFLPCHPEHSALPLIPLWIYSYNGLCPITCGSRPGGASRKLDPT